MTDSLATTPASAGTSPQSPFRVTELSIEDGMEIATWRTPGPWSVADALETPEPDEGYWAVRDADGVLVGYCCFGESARAPGQRGESSTLDVALGLRPDLVGRGLSNALTRAVVERARNVAAGRKLRTAVAEWNEPGRRAAGHAGFRVTGAHAASTRDTAYLVFSMR